MLKHDKFPQVFSHANEHLIFFSLISKSQVIPKLQVFGGVAYFAFMSPSVLF